MDKNLEQAKAYLSHSRTEDDAENKLEQFKEKLIIFEGITSIAQARKLAKENFYIENDDRTYIGSKTSFYDENGKHLKLADVSKKLSDKCKDLQKWVDSLPNINNK